MTGLDSTRLKVPSILPYTVHIHPTHHLLEDWIRTTEPILMMMIMPYMENDSHSTLIDLDSAWGGSLVL